MRSIPFRLRVLQLKTKTHIKDEQNLPPSELEILSDSAGVDVTTTLHPYGLRLFLIRLESSLCLAGSASGDDV